MSVTQPIYPPVEELLHGVVVRDPYRWLEDRNLQETEKWILGQQQRCEEYFAACGELDMLRMRVRERLDVEMIDQPARVAGRYFYRRRNQGQEQACIYVLDPTLGLERILVDPAPMGPFISVGIHQISVDGSLLAFELKDGGEDTKTIRIVNVKSGDILPDAIRAGYARGFVFTEDLRGFFCCHEFSISSDRHAIHMHFFGGSEDDEIVFQLPRSPASNLVLTGSGSRLAALMVRHDLSEPVGELWTANQNNPTEWRQISRGRKQPHLPVLANDRILAVSYDGAPNGKIVALAEDGDEHCTVVPEQEGTIRQITIVGGNVFVHYICNLISAIRHWNLEGEAFDAVDIPANGTIQLLPGQSSKDMSLFYTYESFGRPLVIFEYKPETGKSEVWHERSFPAEDMCIHTLLAESRSGDGTSIPMTLVSRTPIVIGEERPAIMTCYGGFGVAATPQFSVLVSIMMNLGVLFAVTHVRGGGDLGQSWHDAGKGRRRQTSFDDFIASAEWLCNKKLTNPNRLALFGSSNSGLLVGAVMTQRPDLFAAALCIAPLLDMVRYESFDQAAKWGKEYGTIHDAEDFHALYAYSPFHHIQGEVNYPATLFVTGDRDDRCNPAHVRKMAARLQNREAQASPIIVDYTKERGHSPVLPLSIRVEALARRIAFLCHEMNTPVVIGDCHEALYG